MFQNVLIMKQFVSCVVLLMLGDEQVISLEIDDSSSQDQTWTETAMSSLLRDTVELFDPCLLIIAHDYQPLLPTAFINIIHNRSLTGKTTAIIKHQPTPTATTPSTGPPDPNEHWFSWLHRSSRKYHRNCVFATVLFDSMEHFEQLMEQTAKIISLHTTQHHFLFWHRNDLDPFNPSWLLHPHSHVMLYKLAAVPTPSGKDIKLFSTCFYCQQGKPQIVTVGLHDHAIPHQLSIQSLFPDFTSNLYGKHMKGSFVYGMEKEELRIRISQCAPVYFIDAMWLLFADHLNFNFHVTALEIDESGLADTQLPNGQWVGNVGRILYGTHDFSTLAPTSAHTLEVVDQTRTFLMDYINFLTRVPNPNYSWTAIVQPYTYNMWILILIACSISTTIFWIIIKLLERFQNPFAPKHFPRHSLGYSIRYLFFTVVEENPELLPNGHTLRVFLAFWWLYSIVITCAYDCKLISFLASPQLEDLPTNFAELTSKDGWRWGMNKSQAAFYHMMVQNSDNPALRAVEPYLEPTPDFFTCLGSTLEGDYACITAETFLVPGSMFFVYQDGHNPMMLQNEKNLLLYFSPLLEKHSVLIPVLNNLIVRMFDSGILEKHTKDCFYCAFMTGLRIARMTNRVRKTSMAFKLEQFKGPLLVLLVFGWFLPMFIFVLERYKKNSISSSLIIIRENSIPEVAGI